MLSESKLEAKAEEAYERQKEELRQTRQRVQELEHDLQDAYAMDLEHLALLQTNAAEKEKAQQAHASALAGAKFVHEAKGL